MFCGRKRGVRNRQLQARSIGECPQRSHRLYEKTLADFANSCENARLMNPTPMPPPLVLRGTIFDPPLFCAPMANITHSAFRHVVAEYGGCGALFSEMLCAKMILKDDLKNSPWLKRRPGDGKLIYQLLVTSTDNLPEILARLATLAPDGLDLNCACAAWNVRNQGGGGALFEDAPRMQAVVRVLRANFAGPLTVKIRLGNNTPLWRERLLERVRLLADEGVDALTLHPRFSEDKFKRTAHHEMYAELAAATSLPLIANGDISGPEYCAARAAAFAPVAGIMIGRMAAGCPWVFAKWREPEKVFDPAEAWMRFFAAISEDFPDAGHALTRVKIMTAYLARNYLFGHTFFVTIQNAPTLAAARERAAQFFATQPERHDLPHFEGV